MEELVLQDKPGFFSKIADRLFTRGDDEEAVEYERPTRGRSLEIKVAPRYSVMIRRQIVSFDDAMEASRSLMNGEQQILNLTGTDPMIRQKIIDFVSGVNFALQGTWEEVGDHIYLVAPKSAYVEAAPATPIMSAMRSN